MRCVRAQLEVSRISECAVLKQELFSRQFGAGTANAVKVTFIFFDPDCAANQPAFALSMLDQS